MTGNDLQAPEIDQRLARQLSGPDDKCIGGRQQLEEGQRLFVRHLDGLDVGSRGERGHAVVVEATRQKNARHRPA